MITGPYPKGHWTRHTGYDAFKHLQPHLRYEVIREFKDFDDDVHPVGETWVWLGHNFLPYDGGYSFFVSVDGEHEWHIRMQESDQSEILDNLAAYIRAVP